MTIQICDETLPGRGVRGDAIEVEEGPLTIRDLLRMRVRREVEFYNALMPETFQGLVQPEESEQILNGFRMRERRRLDWEAQFRRACSSFERNGFLILVDRRQVTELDEPLDLHTDSEVQFVKLVPLVGG